MPQHLASHPSQANSKRTHLKGPDVSRSDSPPVQRSAPMQVNDLLTQVVQSHILVKFFLPH